MNNVNEFSNSIKIVMGGMVDFVLCGGAESFNNERRTA